VRTIGSRLLDLALPAACPGCGREGAPICAACGPALEARLDRPPGILIGLPADLPAPLLQLEWCAPFNGVVRAALHALKYSGERRLAVPLGEVAARRWQRAGAGGDLVVPVPVHADRARTRGYDQAVLLAAVVAARLDLPMASLLERHRRTIAQFELDRKQRGTNVSGAFRLRSGGTPTLGADRALRGRWVILVDDVTTTGATLAACAEALMEAGALGVSGLTVARER
jgi:ComF family protein